MKYSTKEKEKILLDENLLEYAVIYVFNGAKRHGLISELIGKNVLVKEKIVSVA